ncbi:response regulator transcription factor [Pelomonas sp. KK5]|uniref:response regulator transcription factor n=1 Tax=Pelomonas sp. KK5 TaxID=1855730 RepID=UPI00117FF4B9|nr:response regulator transcription factor [Pelomonas sp. KK5]
MPSVFLLRRCRPALQKSRAAVMRLAGWWVCGEGERVREAGEAIAALRPDIVACDLRLLDGHATRLAYEMRGWAGRRPQMLLLSSSNEDLRLFDALSAGADSYAADTGDGEGLADGLRRLADRRAPMTASIAQQALAAFGVQRSRLAAAQLPTAGQDLGPTGAGLSMAEQHLLSLLAQGWLLPEIGERWLLQPAEIEQRLWRIYARLHARQPLPAAQAAGGSVSMKLWRAASFS